MCKSDTEPEHRSKIRSMHGEEDNFEAEIERKDGYFADD